MVAGPSAPFAEDAEPVTLDLPPGLFTERTERGRTQRWKDGEKVRFKNGLPQKLGGWVSQPLTGAANIGVPRRTHEWRSLDRTNWIAVGTNAKLYLISQNVRYDITPQRRSINRTNPFTTSSGLPTVTVTDAGHGAIQGDYVTYSGATSVGGLTLNGEYRVQTVTGVDTYTITASSNASSNATGGGSVAMAYDINNGGEDTGLYYGYGTCTYGASTYGTPRGVCSTMVRNLRIWSLDNWGEDLIASPSEGEIYVWDRTLGTSTRAQLIAGAPRTNQRVLVSTDNRQLVALGATNLSGAPDPLLIRVSDNENYEQFISDDDNNAYLKRIDSGSKIVTGIKTRSSILVCTDAGYHLMQPDSDLVYDTRILSEGNPIIGPNAGIDVDGVVYLMSYDKFMIYDGVVQELPCEVWTRVFSSLNVAQRDKVTCWYNDVFGEVWWFYPSGGSTENDRYVVYNRTEKHWTYGSMARTAAGSQSKFYNKPYALNSTGVLYLHESGTDDDTNAMSAYLDSYDVQLGDGREQMHIARVVPDNLQQTGNISLTFFTKRRPEDASYVTKGPYTVATSTSEFGTRARGRQCAIRFASNALSSHWRLGAYTFYVQPDGER